MTSPNVPGLPELPVPEPLTPTRSDLIRARLMFTLGFLHLLLMAGLIHRAVAKEVTPLELDVTYAGLAILWPVFVVEALWGVSRRDRLKPRRPVLLRAILVAFMPPWRMALPDPRTGLIWIPRIGWQKPGKDLFKRLDLAFGGPMLLFAFLILPILGLEYVRSDEVHNTPELALALDIGIAVIWVAFATELVFQASAHPKPFSFATERWMDVAIVVLPMLEFLLTRWVDVAPLARLLRAGRALSPEQLARMQRLYRLQGVTMKAWHGLLLLRIVARLFGQTPLKQLASLEEKIADLEEELAELKKDAAAIREQVQSPDQNHPEDNSAGGTGEPSGEVATASNLPSKP